MQIFNQVLGVWETIDYCADAESEESFELSAHIFDLTDYKDESNIISCRVYQLTP